MTSILGTAIKRTYNADTKKMDVVTILSLPQGSSARSTTYTLAADSTWYDALPIELPDAGTYQITATIEGNVKVSATVPSTLSARLYDVRKAIVLPNTTVTVTSTNLVNVQSTATATINATYTISERAIIRIQVSRSVATWTTSTVTVARLKYAKIQ